jgi:hypothetical protein
VAAWEACATESSGQPSDCSSIVPEQTLGRRRVSVPLHASGTKIVGRKGLRQDAAIRQTTEPIAGFEIAGNLEAGDPRRVEADEDLHAVPSGMTASAASLDIRFRIP